MRKLIYVFALVIFSATLIFAQQHQMRMNREGKHHGMSLSDEQMAKMEDMHLALQKEMLPLKSQLKSLRTELKLLLVADKYDAGKVDQVIQKMSAVRTRMQKAMVRHQRAMRDMLTPEQRKKFDSRILSGRRGHHQKMMGMKKMMRDRHPGMMMR